MAYELYLPSCRRKDWRLGRWTTLNFYNFAGNAAGEPKGNTILSVNMSHTKDEMKIKQNLIIYELITGNRENRNPQRPIGPDLSS